MHKNHINHKQRKMINVIKEQSHVSLNENTCSMRIHDPKPQQSIGTERVTNFKVKFAFMQFNQKDCSHICERRSEDSAWCLVFTPASLPQSYIALLLLQRLNVE